MNQKICSKCGTYNNFEMLFCTNCGIAISVNKQSEIPTVEKKLEDFTNVKTNKQKNKTTSNLKIFGILGCLGLFVLFVFIFGIVLFYNLSKSQNIVVNSNKNQSNTNLNKNISEKENNEEKEAENSLTAIFEDRKDVGRFKLLTVNSVKKEDFFSYSIVAKQASYHDGSKYVSVAVGKFADFENAKKSFDEQFANAKKKGGKTQILETPTDGTINGVYQVKDVFSAEYCTKSAFCYRLVSKDPKSLKYFIENFITL
jgi:hypothetical protein